MTWSAPLASGADHEALVAEILAVVRRRTGVDFSGYRHAMVQRRLLNRMVSLGLSCLEEYLTVLESSDGEAAALVGRLTIKVSRFYRHASTFDMLRRQVLPELARMRAGSPIRIWCAGCGCGEEAYTLGILLEEAGAPGTVEATDIDPVALDTARAGTYGADAIAELPPDLLARYLEASDAGAGGRYRVGPAVRRHVRCSLHDLTSSAPAPGGGRFDLITCRNVLIYLQRDVQAHAVGRLRDSLVPGGYLCLGEAEWPPRSLEQSLERLGFHTRVFRAALAACPPI